MITELCDICKKEYLNHKFKVKKEQCFFDGMCFWLKYKRIDICDACYNKLINATENEQRNHLEGDND